MNKYLAIVLSVALAMVTVPAVRHLREEPPPPPDTVRLSLAPPAGVESGFADETLDAAISPDDSAIVFVATDVRTDATGRREGIRRLWRRTLDAGRAEPLAGTEGAQQPAWKPTGNVIAFFADGRLKQLALPDGTVHDLADAPAAAGAAWLDDGSLLFATGSGAIRRLREGQLADATRLGPGDAMHAFPSAGPSGEFVYIAVRADGRRVVRVRSGETERELATTSGHAMLAGNYLLHVRDGTLLSYARDAETGALAPRGVPLALNVGVSSTGRALFTASARLVLHAPITPSAVEMVWLDRSGARESGLADAGDYWQVRLSPDDRMVAAARVDPLLRALDIVLAPASGSATTARQFTLALAAETDPVWSPDAARVLFRSMEGGSPNLLVRRLEQTDANNEPMRRSELDETPTDWARGQILLHARGRTGLDVLRLDVQTGDVSAVAATPFNERDGRWSPDGRWVAFVSDESGQPDVYAMAENTRVRVSFAGGTKPRWSYDGRALLFLRGSQIMRAEVSGTSVGRAEVLFDAAGIRDFDVAHRSDRILALLPVKPGARGDVSAILNWMTLARR